MFRRVSNLFIKPSSNHKPIKMSFKLNPNPNLKRKEKEDKLENDLPLKKLKKTTSVRKVTKSNSETISIVEYNREKLKSTSNGKDYNFKIVSWNVNGIRACIGKGCLEYLKAEDPDIFCVQETKCDQTKIPLENIPSNYHSFWLSGDAQGYSGVGLLTKVKPINVTYGMNNKKFDTEGRLICAEYEKFYVINTYIPNSSAGLIRLPFRLEWESELQKLLVKLNQHKPIIWCGDLNVAHHRIDIRYPNAHLRSAGFTIEERECFTSILADGYFDSFRYLYPERVSYTFFTYRRYNARESNAGWRLDYFVLSEKLKSALVDNIIRKEVKGSDHCPIVLCLNI